MNTKTSNWVRRLAGITALLMIFMSNAGLASARILFQDDTVGQIESDSLNIGSNDAGAVSTSLKFGADATAAENGVINWNIATNTFELDHTAAITGGLSATGAVNFSGSTGFRAREVAGITNPGTLCGTVGELIVDTVTNILYICTNAGTDAWQAAGSGTNAATLDSLDSTDFLRSTASTTFGTGGAFTLTVGADDTLLVDGTLDTNGVATIGDGGDAVTIDSSTWDVTGAGVGSGFTGFTSTGAIDFSGATSFLMTQGAANPGTCTEGSLFYNTTDNTTYVCTAANTFTALSSGGADTFESVYAADGDKSLSITDNLAVGFEIKEGVNPYLTVVTTDGSEAVQIKEDAVIGDNGDTVVINSSDWDINATGDMTGIGAVTMDGLLTGTLGATISGAAINLNASSNFATNIGTGTTTSTVSIGGGANGVAIDSTTWDVTTAGAASGFTTIGASGNITTSAGTFCVGTTCLNETTSAVDSGGFLVGVFDEFDNSASTTVQGVLNDLDAQIGANADNVEVLTFYPEYPDTVFFRDGTSNNGTLIAEYDDTNDEHYYNWTSNNATTQDIDLKFRFPLPADFVSTGDFTFRFRTGSAVEADNDVEVYVYNATDETATAPTLCGSDVSNVNAGAWATGTITAATLNAGCTVGTALNASDIVEVAIKLMDNTGAPDFADVGFLSLAYSN